MARAQRTDEASRLAGSTRRLFALLGLPTLGLSLAITTVSAMVPLLLRHYTPSQAVSGAVVGGEGLMALGLPLLLGAISDRTKSKLGSRLPFVLGAAPACVLGLAMMPFGGSLGGVAACVLVFYVGYYVYYPPYRALYPDLVPPEQMGRSQGVQTIFREIGLGVSLIGAPLVLGAWEALPFLLSAFLVAVLSVIFVIGIRKRAATTQPTARGRGVSLWRMVRDHGDVRRVLAANALWELALAGIRTFVVLYILAGLGRSKSFASALMGIVAVVAVIAAPLAGHLGDRFGTSRVMRLALVVFGVGLILPVFTTSLAVLLPVLPVIGFGGAVAMTLPYALLTERLPETSHGAGAGLYDFSRGVGMLLGPVVTGAAIDLSRPWLRDSNGYGAMWLVTGIAVLVSVPLMPVSKPPERAGSAAVTGASSPEDLSSSHPA